MQNKPHILITGATGFVGRALTDELLVRGFSVVAGVRKHSAALPGEIFQHVVGDLLPETNWSAALIGVDVVIHAAARVHVMKETARDPLAEFRKANVAATGHLARMASEAGVRRFVFLSSVGVNGNETHEQPFTEEDEPHCKNHYALSKLEAEKALHRISAETGMEVVVIRAPLVYGPGNPGNFLRLLNWVDRSLPLPLALVNNRRSFIYLGNLLDAIVTCINHHKASGQTYLVSDNEDISTPELIRQVAGALGRPTRLFPFPLFFMKSVGRITGKSDAVDRLLGSLVVDSSKIRRELGRKPPYTMEEGLKETAEWFKTSLHAK